MQQYAVAINIPAGKCGPGIVPHLIDDPQEVRNIINPPNRRTYESASMIAALPNQGFHSEYRLMKDPNEQNSPLAKLLNRNPLGCVIFYTYFSPCDQACLNPANTRNILTAIQMFRRHRGPKAFVYNQIFNNNDAGIVNKGRVINENAFLYRCYPNPTAYGCHHCIQDNQIRPECRAQRQQNYWPQTSKHQDTCRCTEHCFPLSIALRIQY